MLKVTKYFPVTIKIDGEPVKLRIKRMTLEEHTEYSRRGEDSGTPSWVRFISREPSGVEQERDDEGKYKIPFERLVQQKLEALGPEKFAEYEKAEEEREARGKAFLVYAFEKFVTVAGGLVEEQDDGTEATVHEGIDFLRIFGARSSVLAEVVALIGTENRLPAEKKRVSRSRVASLLSSTEPDQAPDGTKRETTALNVEIAGSVPPGDANDQQASPSGPTDHGS